MRIMSRLWNDLFERKDAGDCFEQKLGPMGLPMC